MYLYDLDCHCEPVRTLVWQFSDMRCVLVAYSCVPAFKPVEACINSPNVRIILSKCVIDLRFFHVYYEGTKALLNNFRGDSMKINFGSNLRKLRIERNLTQENLADLLGVSFQTISKWERGDVYPDIATLPDIAKFFAISTDDLLGVDATSSEEKIIKIIETIDGIKTEASKEKTELIQKAISEFPADFRLQLRWMANLMFKNNGKDYVQVKSKILTIYNNIQNNCMDDPIRFRAKRYMAQYYNALSEIHESGYSFSDVQSIVEQMPKLRDSQEFCKAFLYFQHPDRRMVIQDSLEEEISILHHGLVHYGVFNYEIPAKERIKIAEITLKMHELLFDDGHYGTQWLAVMYLNGYLAAFYYEAGEPEKTLVYLQKCAELAIRFDNLDRISTMKSAVFCGKEFDKHAFGNPFSAKLKMVSLMKNKYPFDESFKNSAAFKEIINLLTNP